jgi:hypothetical protein
MVEKLSAKDIATKTAFAHQQEDDAEYFFNKEFLKKCNLSSFEPFF